MSDFLAALILLVFLQHLWSESSRAPYRDSTDTPKWSFHEYQFTPMDLTALECVSEEFTRISITYKGLCVNVPHTQCPGVTECVAACVNACHQVCFCMSSNVFIYRYISKEWGHTASCLTALICNLIKHAEVCVCTSVSAYVCWSQEFCVLLHCFELVCHSHQTSITNILG